MPEKSKNTAKSAVIITGPKASRTLRKIPTADLEPKPGRVRVGQQFAGENVLITNPKAAR